MKKFLPRTINNPEGFTLVELLVVIAIIAILAVVGLTVYANTQQRSRDARRRSDIEAIARAYETRYDPNSTSSTKYPPLQGSWFAAGSTPQDPNGTTYIGYNTAASVSAFSICAVLENPASSVCIASQQQ